MKKRFVSAIALAMMTSMVFLAGCSKTAAVAESSSESSGMSSNEKGSESGSASAGFAGFRRDAVPERESGNRHFLRWGRQGNPR